MGPPRERILKVHYRADAGLDIVLRGGIEPGAHVVHFPANGETGVDPPVRSSAELQGKSVLAFVRCLGIHMDAAD